MNRTRSQILRCLIRNGPMSLGVLASGLQTSRATVRRHLLLLESAGYVQSLGEERYSAHTSLIEGQLRDIAAQYCVPIPPMYAPSMEST
ncbi:winged helix-turn-helix domain-containing protein [Paenarthrobacter sp. YIM B13468]|uniref:winged helix-turn-helix domain-containing protein n=1 Tax=Paenarthrobacter sp. YIM B13468 TaxID=3366295 RepID=UPI00366E33AC